MTGDGDGDGDVMVMVMVTGRDRDVVVRIVRWQGALLTDVIGRHEVLAGDVGEDVCTGHNGAVIE